MQLEGYINRLLSYHLQPLRFKPCPLHESEEENYRLVLKQQLRVAMQDSPYYVRPATANRDIQRYSDKYRTTEYENSDSVLGWNPDWRLLPKELRMRVRKTGTRKGQNTIQVARVKKEGEDEKKTEPLVDVTTRLEVRLNY
jgi:DNA-directed RNA polymerase III subunit RPC7